MDTLFLVIFAPEGEPQETVTGFGGGVLVNELWELLKSRTSEQSRISKRKGV